MIAATSIPTVKRRRARAAAALPTPYYDDRGITLYHGDVRDILPRLKLGTVDAVITDPPYEETNLRWDKWVAGWPALVRPLSRQLWCFGSFRMFWDHREEFAGWSLAQDVVWEKHNGSGIRNDRFRRVHELAPHFYQGAWRDLYICPVKVDPPPEALRGGFIKARGAKPQHFGEIEANASSYQRDQLRLMRSVIPVASCHGSATNETQKPEGIVAPLVEYSVPVGGTVFDPFAGSGTTLAVAYAQGKRAIGIEVRESQCRDAADRFSQMLPFHMPIPAAMENMDDLFSNPPYS